MWPSTSCPLSSVTRNIVLGRASETSPSISILSSLLRITSLLGAAKARSALQLGHVHGLGTLVPRFFVVGDLAVLLERLEAGAVDAGVMDEEVAVALVGRDEPVALLVVEPLHRTGGHAFCLPSLSDRGRARHATRSSE